MAVETVLANDKDFFGFEVTEVLLNNILTAVTQSMTITVFPTTDVTKPHSSIAMITYAQGLNVEGITGLVNFAGPNGVIRRLIDPLPNSGVWPISANILKIAKGAARSYAYPLVITVMGEANIRDDPSIAAMTALRIGTLVAVVSMGVAPLVTPSMVARHIVERLQSTDFGFVAVTTVSVAIKMTFQKTQHIMTFAVDQQHKDFQPAITNLMRWSIGSNFKVSNPVTRTVRPFQLLRSAHCQAAT
jgi:hypothetical protein